jgi:hypothetical protein
MFKTTKKYVENINHKRRNRKRKGQKMKTERKRARDRLCQRNNRPEENRKNQ